MAAEPRAVWQGPGLEVGTRNPSEGRAGGREQRKPAKNWPSEQAPLQDPVMGWVWGRDLSLAGMGRWRLGNTMRGPDWGKSMGVGLAGLRGL